VEAKKFDNGKAMLSLNPIEALEGSAKVLKMGMEKYDRDNWRLGLPYTRVIDAALRHIHAFNNGEDLDEESGLLHIDHAMVNLMMLSSYYKTGTGEDDRYKKEK